MVYNQDKIYEHLRYLPSSLSHYVKGPISVQIVDFEKANFEFLKSQLEVTSKVCKNIKEARAEVIRLRRLASNYAEANNCKIIGLK